MAGNKGMGHGRVQGHQGVGSADPDLPEEEGLQEALGHAKLHSNKSLPADAKPISKNQRMSVPDETNETEGVLESFERMDDKAKT